MLPDFELLLELTADVEPDTAQKDAEKTIIKNMKSDEALKELESHLSSEVQGEIKIKDIREGSIIIVIGLKNLECLQRIYYLSSTGYLSESLQDHLVTQKLLETCKASRITLNVSVIQESYRKLVQQAQGTVACIIFFYVKVFQMIVLEGSHT